MQTSPAGAHLLRYSDHTDAGWSRISVRRSGRRPLLLNGRVLLEAASEDPAAEVRHVIKLIEISEGGYGYALEQWVEGRNIPYAEGGTGAVVADIAEILKAFDAAAPISADISGDQDAATALARVSKTRSAAVKDYAATLARIVKPS